MKRLLLVLAVATTASAQSNGLTFSLVQPQFSGASASLEGERLPITLRSRSGFRLEGSHDFGRASFGIDVARFTAPATATFPQGTIGVGSLTLTPISATVALHGNLGRVQPYIGAGAAYLMTGNLRSRDLDAAGIGAVSVGEDFTFLATTGLVVPVSNGLAFRFDARYMPVSVGARPAVPEKATVKFNAVTIGAGLRWNF